MYVKYRKLIIILKIFVLDIEKFEIINKTIDLEKNNFIYKFTIKFK